MLDKLINWWIDTGEELAAFNTKTQEKIKAYSNKQVRKTAIVCGIAGLIVGLAIGKLL